MGKKWVWILAAIVILGFIFWKPLYLGWLNFWTGGQAVQDAATATGYTTYNRSIYTPPIWNNLVTFFKPDGAYVPSGSSSANGSGAANYSVQG